MPGGLLPVAGNTRLQLCHKPIVFVHLRPVHPRAEERLDRIAHRHGLGGVAVLRHLAHAKHAGAREEEDVRPDLRHDSIAGRRILDGKVGVAGCNDLVA